MKKSFFALALILLTATTEVAAQIEYGFQFSFSDGSISYTGVLALNSTLSGMIRVKTSTGQVVEQTAYWAPTQEDDSFWLICENVKYISGSTVNYNPDYILVRFNPDGQSVSMFFNTAVTGGMIENGDIMFYPTEKNIYFKATNTRLMTEDAFEKSAQNVRWSLKDALKSVANVQSKFWISK